MKVPYVDIAGQHRPIKAELMAAVERVLDKGQFILGEEVSAFEQEFARLCNCRFAVGVNSGTDALILCLRALGIGPGDEVITAPNSFVASASCIELAGAVPVFVDVRDDFNIDPALIERSITPRTRAILPVHLTGRAADMDPIMNTARARNLKVIEDSAQAVFAKYRGRSVGSFGDTSCFSLHPLKTLNACGDGGVVTTNDEGVFGRLLLLRNLGLKTRDNAVVWSSNSRLDTLQAALLLVKLNYVFEWTARRRANAEFYRGALGGIAGVRLPVEAPYEEPVYHTFVVEADHRDELKAYLERHDVSTAIHYPRPIHLQDAARRLEYPPGSFPVAERQAGRILSLPVYPELRQEQLEYTAALIRRFYSS